MVPIEYRGFRIANPMGHRVRDYICIYYPDGSLSVLAPGSIDAARRMIDTFHERTKQIFELQESELRD